MVYGLWFIWSAKWGAVSLSKEKNNFLNQNIAPIYNWPSCRDFFFANKVNCKVGTLHNKLTVALEWPIQNHAVICAICQLVTVTAISHIQIPLRPDLIHVLSFAFSYFEKLSFQDFSVFSPYNILDLILDKFDFFSPILKLVIYINQTVPLHKIAKFFILPTPSIPYLIWNILKLKVKKVVFFRSYSLTKSSTLPLLHKHQPINSLSNTTSSYPKDPATQLHCTVTTVFETV